MKKIVIVLMAFVILSACDTHDQEVFDNAGNPSLNSQGTSVGNDDDPDERPSGPS